jgi:hypothetical protein
LTEDFKNET